LVGGLAAGNLAIFAALVRRMHASIYVAATISFVLATLANYSLSVRYVFVSGARFSKNREIAVVYIVSAIGLIASLCILFILADLAKLDAILAQALALAALFLWNYAARNFCVFRRQDTP
jgi:putative flippase GtrA